VLVALRHRCVRWLRQLGWPEAPAADAVVSLDAAVSNAVQHAYPDAGGRVRVHALAASERSGRSAARFTVRDWGQWRPRGPSWRGYGMALMGELSEELFVETGKDGTTVVLTTPIVVLPRFRHPLR
jgi:serine/threonine-protein kinase RsbW